MKMGVLKERALYKRSVCVPNGPMGILLQYSTVWTGAKSRQPSKKDKGWGDFSTPDESGELSSESERERERWRKSWRPAASLSKSTAREIRLGKVPPPSITDLF